MVMDIKTFSSYDWSMMAPEFIIVGVAALLCIVDLFLKRDKERKLFAWISVIGILLAMISLFGLMDHEASSILNETFRLDSFAKGFKLILLIGAAMVILLTLHYKTEDEIKYRGEFYYLFLAALLGAMMMSSSGDMITLFVGLELLSVSSYILAGIRKNHTQSNESAMKYVITGGISTAITLFGMSYVYGLTGTTNLVKIAAALQPLYDKNLQYLLALAFLMIFVGLSFKLATAPFHMWAPDVYQGAPTPVTAFLSVVSKTAGFALVIRMLLVIFINTPAEGGASPSMLLSMQYYIAFLAGVTMVIGNTVALKQRNIKRLFAYSSVAHAGYLLVAFASLSYFTLDTIWFYLAVYLFMNMGVFAIIQVMIEKSGTEDISGFAGLYKRSPFVAVAMAIFILSLAGFPGTAGFIGKIKIFLSAFATEPAHIVLAGLMIATTVVSYFYYFGVMVQMFFRPAESTEKVKLPLGIAIVVVVCLIGTLGLGIFPEIVLDYMGQHFNQFGDLFQK